MLFKRYNVFFFGLTSAGKTTFMNAYLHPDKFDSTHSATGANEKSIKNGWLFFGDFRFHDMGGSENFRTLYDERLKNVLRIYTKECPICVIVLDYQKYTSSLEDKKDIDMRIGEDLIFINEIFGSGVPLFFVGTHKWECSRYFYQALNSPGLVRDKIQKYGFSFKTDRCRTFNLKNESERLSAKKWFGEECDKCY